MQRESGLRSSRERALRNNFKEVLRLLDENLSQESVILEAMEDEPDGDNVGEELEQAGSRAIELEDLLAQREEQLDKANARISELEQVVAESGRNLAQAVSDYKQLIIKSTPGVLDELVVGETIEEINSALERARVIVGRVRQGLEAEMASAKVPAGAPERTPVDLSALSPREKIQYAIGGKR